VKLGVTQDRLSAFLGIKWQKVKPDTEVTPIAWCWRWMRKWLFPLLRSVARLQFLSRVSGMDEITGASVEELISQLLAQPVSSRFETKRVSGKMVGKALETICAFANTKGGTLALHEFRGQFTELSRQERGASQKL